jgi:arylsulfatase A-like enzyme
MKRTRKTLWLGLLTALALLVAMTFWALRPAAAPTNIVLIVVDTTRADHIGSLGYERDTTPNIDRLAREATVFEQAYSHAPWTMSSVASILTSLAPRDHGITQWGQPLSTSHLTLAEHLSWQGYRTSAFVSHVIFDPRYNFDQGFQDYDYSALQGGHPHKMSTSKKISELAIAWLTENAQEPFFLWLHYFDAHAEYLRHEDFDFGEEPVDRYDSEIRYTDEQIGEVLQTLEELDRWDDTIVVFVADHGEEFLEHGRKGHTRSLYDEVIRVPLIVYVPGFAPTRVTTVVSASDLAPTLCNLVGLPTPPQFSGIPFAVDGRSFRVEKQRAVFMETLNEADKRGVRYDRWKLIQDRENAKFELFDLEADPGETRNVFSDHHEVAARLHKSILEHYRRKRAVVEEQQVPDRLRERLEALGYLR